MKQFKIVTSVNIEAENLEAAQQVIDRILINNFAQEHPDPWITALFENAKVMQIIPV